MDELVEFLLCRYDEDAQFARDLVSSSIQPSAAYALAVTLAHRTLAQIEVGRRLLVRCSDTTSDDQQIRDLKRSVLLDLAGGYSTHPAYKPSW